MNINNYIKIENLIGVGSSRAVYRANDKVIKINLSSIGYLQTKVEGWFANLVNEKLNKTGLFNEVEDMNETFSVSKYIKPISKEDFDITCSDRFNDSNYYDYEDEAVELARIFDICTDDWLSATNRGLIDGKLTLIDYGMRNAFYLNQKDYSTKSKEEIHKIVLDILNQN